MRRREKLKLAIDKHFRDQHPNDVDRTCSSYDDSTTEMFEVIKVKQRNVEVMHLFDDLTYSPVQFPTTIGSLIKERDVFLMTLGLKNGCWDVLYMSHPYS